MNGNQQPPVGYGSPVPEAVADPPAAETAAQAAVSSSVPHVCFTGTLSCSGCNPCPVCYHQIRTRVVPAALAASALNGAMLEAVQIMASVLLQNGVDPAALGVHPNLLQATSEEQIAWFYQGLDQGFAKLHASMRVAPGTGDGMGLLGQFQEQRVALVVEPQASSPKGQALGSVMGGLGGDAVPAASVPSGVLGGVQPLPAAFDASQPGSLEALLKQAAPAKAVHRAPTLPRTLSAEDLAAAGSLVDPPSTPTLT